MALIANNISGSASNSSRIGITGSVIIANNPGSSFPSFPNPEVTFFVSGSNTSIGADQPSIVFKGDTFVSGAFGVSDYIQMNPVGSLRIPTNKSASYIYTSGSTNDLYFTQYAPGTNFTNTTRLRWLESTLSTGLLHGGLLSTQAGTTTFSITSGSGIIVAPNASLTQDPYPTTVLVNFPAYVSQSLTYVATAPITYIGINASGGIIQRTTPFTNGDYLDYINVGRIFHESSVTRAAATSPSISYSVPQQLSHFTRAFGALKISGHSLAASSSAGIGTLGLTKTTGEAYSEGTNYTFDPDDPNYATTINDPAVTTSKIYRLYVNGSSTLILDTGIGGAGYTVIDTGQYNNNGTLASVGGGQYTIQRVYWFPNSIDRALYVYYGNALYSSLNAAEAAIASETFTEGDVTKLGAVFVGCVLVRGNATDLTNTAQARFVQGGLFRSIVSTGGGGATSVTPGGLDTYVQFNDGGSTFGGDAGLTYDKNTDTLTVAGDVAVNGGDLTTTASTFNLLNGATTINLGSTASNRLINIGTGTAVQSINIGSENTSSSLILLAGTGNMLLSGSTTATYTIGSSLGTGTITIGRSTDANIISIGSAGNNTANDQTVFIANGTGKSTVTIGSNAAHTGKTTIQAGTSSGGGVVIAQSAGRLGFFGLSTPVTVQSATGDTSVSNAGSTNTVFRNTTFTGGAGAAAYTIGDIVKALKAYGLIST
jgi:hypothetical protein